MLWSSAYKTGIDPLAVLLIPIIGKYNQPISQSFNYIYHGARPYLKTIRLPAKIFVPLALSKAPIPKVMFLHNG